MTKGLFLDPRTARRRELIAKMAEVCESLARVATCVPVDRRRFFVIDPEESERESGDRSYIELAAAANPDDFRIFVWLPLVPSSKNRLEIRCARVPSRSGGFGYYDSRTDPSITVAASRSAESIAADMARRFLVPFWTTRFAHFKSRRAAESREQQQRAAAIAMIEEFGDEASYDKINRAIRDGSYVRVYPKDDQAGIDLVDVYGYHPFAGDRPSIEVRLERLSVEETIAVNRLLRRMRGLPEVPPKPVSLWRGAS